MFKISTTIGQHFVCETNWAFYFFYLATCNNKLLLQMATFVIAVFLWPGLWEVYFDCFLFDSLGVWFFKCFYSMLSWDKCIVQVFIDWIKCKLLCLISSQQKKQVKKCKSRNAALLP